MPGAGEKAGLVILGTGGEPGLLWRQVGVLLPVAGHITCPAFPCPTTAYVGFFKCRCGQARIAFRQLGTQDRPKCFRLKKNTSQENP